MPFDPTKDETLAERRIQTGEGRSIGVVVARYRGGPLKVGLRRTYTTGEGEEKPAKLGRVALDEWPRIVEAVEAVLGEAPGCEPTGSGQGR